MKIENWIAVASAAIAFVSFLATMYFANRAARSTETNRLISMGQAETSQRAAITVTRTAVREMGMKIADLLAGRKPTDLKADEKRRLDTYMTLFNETVEDNLNAYETGCMLYIDGKLDKTRFKSAYIREVQNLCEAAAEHPCHAHLHPEGSSKFQAIWKVYREWHHHG
ncbi:MAG: hypothetical protein J0M17_24555 [Planctomycetes bacterium]|nr:hypothetical protein [Planctomycetota bacterium]